MQRSSVLQTGVNAQGLGYAVVLLINDATPRSGNAAWQFQFDKHTGGDFQVTAAHGAVCGSGTQAFDLAASEVLQFTVTVNPAEVLQALRTALGQQIPALPLQWHRWLALRVTFDGVTSLKPLDGV